jgi:cytochrome c553
MKTQQSRMTSVEEAIRTINALRQLTRETGTVTTRSQNSILQSLSDADLVEVARILVEQRVEADRG